MSEKPPTEELEDKGSPEAGMEVWLPQTGVVTVEEVVENPTTPMGPSAGLVKLSDGSIATPFGEDRPESLGEHPELPPGVEPVKWGDAERVVTKSMQEERITRRASPRVGERAGVVFRGGDIGRLTDGVLGSGVIRSQSRQFLRGKLRGGRDADLTGERIRSDSIRWSQDPTENTEPFSVAGGVTTRLPATGRFRGENELVVVLRRKMIPFTPIDYSLDGLREMPEAVSAIPQTMVNPLFVNGELWGATTSAPGRGEIIEKWGPDELMDYTGELFAAEEELIATAEDPNVRSAIEGVLSVARGDVARSDAPDRYAEIKRQLPAHPGQFHLVKFPERPDGLTAQAREQLKIADIEWAYTESGFQDDSQLL